MPNIYAPSGITVSLYSRSGDLYEQFSDTNLTGQLLSANLRIEKRGGLDTFDFTIPRNKDIPITRNNIVKFEVDNNVWYTGYVTDVPLPDQRNPLLTIRGKGFMHRLAEILVGSETYSFESLFLIIADLGTTYLGADAGVYYKESKIRVPATSALDMEIVDRTLLDVFNELLNVANEDYDNYKYRFYIDNEQELVFELLFDDYLRNLYEGVHYQNPTVSIDTSQLINKILTYRTQTGVTDTVEYVNTVEDTGSQNRYGLAEEKLTFPDYISAATITNIADYIIKRNKDPQTIISISDLDITKITERKNSFELIHRGSCRFITNPSWEEETPLGESNCTFERVTYNLIKNGHCELGTIPHMEGETHGISNGSVQRSNEQAYDGQYSFKHAITTTGSVSRYYFGRSATGYMNGFIVGHTYTITLKVYVPTIGGPTLGEIALFLQTYDGAWHNVASQHATGAALDTWFTMTISFTVPNGSTTTVRPFMQIGNTADSGEYYYGDIVYCIDESVPVPRRGNHFYKFLKNNAAGTHAYYAFMDDEATTELHNVAVGDTFLIEGYVYLASTDPDEWDDLNLWFRTYDGTWNSQRIYVNNSSLYDQWAKISGTITIPSGSTGFHFRLQFQSSAVINSLIYIQDLSVIKKIYRPIATPNTSNQNLIDRWQCEDITGPALRWNTPFVVSATFTRSSTRAHTGTYSFKIVSASTSQALAYLHNSFSTDDLNQLLKGDILDLSLWMRADTGDVTLADCEFKLDYYDGSSWSNIVTFTLDAYDTWEYKESKDLLIPLTAEATALYATITSPVAANEQFYIDEVRLKRKQRMPIEFGKYLISNRLDEYWNIGAECDSLDNWDTAGLSTTTLTVVTTRNLTNRRILKFTTAAGSAGEYAEYNLPIKIPFVTAARVFMYFTTFAAPIEITFYDGTDTYTIYFNSFDESLEVTDGTVPVTELLEVDDGLGPDTLEASYTTTVTVDQWIKLYQDITGITYVDKIRITMRVDQAAEIYIDRLDIKASMWKHNALQVEEIDYNLNSLGLFASLYFGEKQESLVDSIVGRVQKSNIALQIFSKQ